MQPLTLRRNFSWTLIGNLVYAASQWGMLVVMAKLGNAEMVGQFTLGLAITAPIITFSNLQLRGIQATDARQQYSFGHYFGLRLISTALALLIITAIVILAGYSWTTALIILLVGISKAIEAISDVFHGLLQQYERMDKIAVSLMLKGPLSLLALGLGIYFTGSLLWGVIGLTIAWLFALLFSDIRNSESLLRHLWKTARDNNTLSDRSFYTITPHWQPQKLLSLTTLALPMGIVMLFVSLNINIPRYVLEQHLGVEDLGIFAAISYLMVAGKLVVSSLAMSADARLSKYYASGNIPAFRHLMLKLLGIGAVLGGLGVVVALVSGKTLLSLLYKPEYGQRNDIFILVMVAALIDYLFAFLGHGMTAARYFRVQMPILATVSLAAVLSSLLLIPTMGMQGAAFSLIISTLVGVLGSLGVLIHACNKKSVPSPAQ
jgi:O-antigen/teichoic acid export membrane protein